MIHPDRQSKRKSFLVEVKTFSQNMRNLNRFPSFRGQSLKYNLSLALPSTLNLFFFFLCWLRVTSFHEKQMLSFSPVWLRTHCLWWQVWVAAGASLWSIIARPNCEMVPDLRVCGWLQKEKLLAHCCVWGWIGAGYFQHKMKQGQGFWKVWQGFIPKHRCRFPKTFFFFLSYFYSPQLSSSSVFNMICCIFSDTKG